MISQNNLKGKIRSEVLIKLVMLNAPLRNNASFKNDSKQEMFLKKIQMELRLFLTGKLLKKSQKFFKKSHEISKIERKRKCE